MVTTMLTLAGKRDAVSFGNPGGRDAVLNFDTYRLQLSDLADLNVSPWTTPREAFGEAAYVILGTRLGSGQAPTVKPYEEALFAALNAKQSSLTATESATVLDSLGVNIDGASAGQFWMTLGIMFQNPTPNMGVKLIAYTTQPQDPNWLVVQAFKVDAAGSASPINSGAINIVVKDGSGTQVAQFSTDLAQTGNPSSPFPLDLRSKLPTGAPYTIIVDASGIGALKPRILPVAIAPLNLVGSGPGLPPSFPGDYLIAADAAGNALNSNFTVTGGSIVWPNPGSLTATGFAIVKPNSTGTLDVTGPSGATHTYSLPDPWARFISVE